MAPQRTGSWAASARGLYLVAMAVFVVTVSIGIANGLDAVEFDRNAILTHVHSGTLGWITLTLVATAAWLYRSMDRRLAITLAVLVPLYVAAFYTTFFGLRAVLGTLLLLTIFWLVIWAWGAYRAGERSLPRLAVALGLTMFALGSLLGVLIQVGFATSASLVPGDSVGAHASTQVFGYVVVAAMGIIEWVVLDPRGISRGGAVQVGALVVGAIVLMLGLLTGTTMIAGLVYLLAGHHRRRGVRGAHLADRAAHRLVAHGTGARSGDRVDLDRRRADPVHGRDRPVHRGRGRHRQGQRGHPHRDRPLGVHRDDHEPDAGLHLGARRARCRPLGVRRPGRVLGDERRAGDLRRSGSSWTAPS